MEDITPETDLTEPNTIILNFFPRAAGSYPCRVLVSGYGAGGVDMRVIEVDAVVTSPPITTTLQFRVPARQSVVQSIPVVNNGSDEWRLSATVIAPGEVFSGPSTLVVPGGGGVGEYPLTFSPAWMCEGVTGKLSLKNPHSGHTLEYDLVGSAVDPLAEEHIVKSCNARETLEIPIKVRGWLGGCGGLIGWTLL